MELGSKLKKERLAGKIEKGVPAREEENTD